MQDILIYGAGGFGMEVAWLIEDINRVKPTWQLVGFIDDDAKKWGQKFNGQLSHKLPKRAKEFAFPHAVAIAIGDSNQRASLVERLRPLNLFFPDTYPSISDHVGNDDDFGRGHNRCWFYPYSSREQLDHIHTLTLVAL